MNKSTGTNIGANLIIAAFGTAIIAPIQYDFNTYFVPNETPVYRNLTSNSWEEEINLSTTYNIEQKINALKTFSEKILKNTKNIDPEILEIVNQNYWDLL